MSAADPGPGPGPGPGPEPGAVRRFRTSWHALRWPVAIAAWLPILLIAVVTLVNAADPGSRHVRAIREVTGVVSVVNYNGTKFCLGTATNIGDDQFCSAVYAFADAPPLYVGERVSGTVIRVDSGPTMAFEAFVVTDPPPAP